MAHKLEEAYEHIEKELSSHNKSIEQQALIRKTKEFAEYLFNKPPLLGHDEDINLEQKNFYYNKAKKMLLELYAEEDEEVTSVEFEHELDKSDIRHIQKVLHLVRQYSKDTFEGVFNNFMRCQNDYQETVKELKLAESSSKDEFVQGLQDEKNEAERKRGALLY